MANKRNLKKAVKAVCGNIAGECIIARNLIPGIDADKMNKIVIDIADLQYQTIANVSFSFDKGKRHLKTLMTTRWPATNISAKPTQSSPPTSIKALKKSWLR